MCGWQEEVLDHAGLILALKRFDPEITDTLSFLTLLCNVVGGGGGSGSVLCLFFFNTF